MSTDGKAVSTDEKERTGGRGRDEVSNPDRRSFQEERLTEKVAVKLSSRGLKKIER